MPHNITKISAKPRQASDADNPESVQPAESIAQTAESSKTKAPHKHSLSHYVGAKKKIKTAHQPGEEKPLKSVFILARPFVALGRYLRDSWRELRMVRWPSRKATWKMTLAVLVYCAIFIVFIVLIDMLFTFIFNLIFGTN